jgi:hypothetical protein
MGYRNTRRFLKEPKELTTDTLLWGIRAGDWHEKLTGHMAEHLAAEKKRLTELGLLDSSGKFSREKLSAQVLANPMKKQDQ